MSILKHSDDALRTLRLLRDQVNMAISMIESGPPMIHDTEDALKSIATPMSGFYIGQFQIRDAGCRGEMKPFAGGKLPIEQCVEELQARWGRPVTLHEAIATAKGMQYGEDDRG